MTAISARIDLCARKRALYREADALEDAIRMVSRRSSMCCDWTRALVMDRILAHLRRNFRRVQQEIRG